MKPYPLRRRESASVWFRRVKDLPAPRLGADFGGATGDFSVDIRSSIGIGFSPSKKRVKTYQ